MRGFASTAQPPGSKEIRAVMTNAGVAFAHYIPGDLDDIVADAGPDELEIVKMDVQASAEALLFDMGR